MAIETGAVLLDARALRLRTDTRLNVPRLQVGDDIIDKHCIVLDALVLFKL